MGHGRVVGAARVQEEHQRMSDHVSHGSIIQSAT